MASAMRSFLLLLLAFLSASTCVDCQTCLSSCYPDLGYSSTCQNWLCFTCRNYVVGEDGWNMIPGSDGVCNWIACPEPSTENHDFCKTLSQQYCFAAAQFQVIRYDRSIHTFAGYCGSCKSGYVINNANTGCVLAESSSPPIDLSPPPEDASPPPSASPPPPVGQPPAIASPPPAASTPPSGTPPGTPPANAGGSSPPVPVPPSSSNEQKKKSEFPKHLKYVLSIAIPAVAAGIIGLFFFFCQRRMHLAGERRKSPLASAVRSQLKLKGVDDFKATLGLQYCTSIEMLAEGLRSSGYIKAPALLGHDTRYLAAAMAAALKQRYESDVSNNQKGFLARFAHDCNHEESLGSLVFDVEEKIRANEGWSRRLAAPPKGSSAQYAAAPTPPPASGIPVGIPAPNFPVTMPPPPMMPPAPSPQNPQPWTPSAPPFDHCPPPTAPYPQTHQ